MANYIEESTSNVSASLQASGVASDVLDIVNQLLTEAGGTSVAKSVVENPTNLSAVTAGTTLVEVTTTSATTPAVVDLKTMSKEAAAELKVIVATGDAPVQANLVKQFSGAVILGDGDNAVTAKGSNDITVQTGTGDDSVKLASGSDSVVLGGGSDSVNTGGGDDVINVAGGNAGEISEIRGGGGLDELNLVNLNISNIVKTGGFVEVTTNNGCIIRVKGMETFIYNDSNGQEVEVSGVKQLLNNWSDDGVA